MRGKSYWNCLEITKEIVVWQKCHSESAARFDKLSDRAADEESISPTADFSRLSWEGGKLGMTPRFKIHQTIVKR